MKDVFNWIWEFFRYELKRSMKIVQNDLNIFIFGIKDKFPFRVVNSIFKEFNLLFLY